MPAPPTEIRVKRKATDDPVELLHIQNEYNGLRQIKQYVFKRQRTSTTPNNNILNTLNPLSIRAQQPAISFTADQLAVRTSKSAGVPATYNQGPEQTPVSLEGTVSTASTGISTGQSSGHGTNMKPSIAAKAEPRRFHLSRNSIRSPAGVTAGHIRGANGTPAVFIERTQVTELDSKASAASVPRERTSASKDASNVQPTNGDAKAQLPSIDYQPRPPAPLRNVRLPSGKVVPWNADSAILAAEMQAYTLREIGLNLANTSTSEASNTSTPIIRARQVSSFKPRAPALRYHERHPEQGRDTEGESGLSQDEIMTDAADPDGDDSGYVVDTYIRMPAEMFEFEDQKNVGLLVLDSQPDIDEFYNDDSDSDSEIYDEEEDENAENHPSTDYPEDEVESADEYGCNPYQRYRNRNASDNEEYDEDDVTYSDEEAKPPWVRRPWMANDAYYKVEQDEEDDN